LLNNKLSSNKIDIKSAKDLRHGIRVNVVSADDYRKLKLTHTLDENCCEYYTYQLPRRKELKVVIRGIFAEMDTETVKVDFMSQGFQPV
jgi:hypothetical protein